MWLLPKNDKPTYTLIKRAINYTTSAAQSDECHCRQNLQPLRREFWASSWRSNAATCRRWGQRSARPRWAASGLVTSKSETANPHPLSRAQLSWPWTPCLEWKVELCRLFRPFLILNPFSRVRFRQTAATDVFAFDVLCCLSTHPTAEFRHWWEMHSVSTWYSSLSLRSPVKALFNFSSTLCHFDLLIKSSSLNWKQNNSELWKNENLDYLGPVRICTSVVSLT